MPERQRPPPSKVVEIPAISVGRMPHQPQLGNIIRDARKVKGYSQYELGKLVGMSAAAVSSWERGRTSPTKNAWRRLCAVMWPGK